MWKVLALIFIVIAIVSVGFIYAGQEVKSWDVSGTIENLDFDPSGYGTQSMTTVFFDDGSVLLIRGEQLNELVIGNSYTFHMGKNRINTDYLNSYEEI